VRNNRAPTFLRFLIVVGDKIIVFYFTIITVSLATVTPYPPAHRLYLPYKWQHYKKQKRTSWAQQVIAAELNRKSIDKELRLLFSKKLILLATALITFRVRLNRGEMYSGHARLCVRVCVSVSPSPHAHTTARTRM